MNLLCPACHAPLPERAVAAADPIVTCPACAAEVDVSRAGTQAGGPRFVPGIDRTNTVLGGYRVEALIGGGGWHGLLPRPRSRRNAGGPEGAVPGARRHAAFVARFAREVETLAVWMTPAIVRVLANGTKDGVPWFAMELVEGPDSRAVWPADRCRPTR